MGPSASNGEHCICIVFDLFVVRSCLELFRFLSFVLHHLYSLTHRIYQDYEVVKLAASVFFTVKYFFYSSETQSLDCHMYKSLSKENAFFTFIS